MASLGEQQNVDYLEILSLIHSTLSPQTYLEIGSRNGDSLRRARCPSIAIDPQFDLDKGSIESKPSCFLFQMTSDKFFSKFSPQALLEGPVDFAFLDGMHLYEFLLRDFMHVEAFSKRNSIIAIHDAIPSDLKMAERVPTLGAAWAGDVWKTMLILKKYRPDLKILCLDAEPTGLVVITNLNAASRLIPERYFSLVDEFRELSLADFGIERYREEMSILPGSSIRSFEALSSWFWL